jgi:hypothetical protein
LVLVLATLVAASCSASTDVRAEPCEAATSTVRDIYDQLEAEASASPVVSDVADRPLCADGPTGRELVEVKTLARGRWCADDPAPGPFLLYRADIVWSRGVVVLDFERSEGSGYREPSVTEIAEELDVDPSLVELNRATFVKASRCLPPIGRT